MSQPVALQRASLSVGAIKLELVGVARHFAREVSSFLTELSVEQVFLPWSELVLSALLYSLLRFASAWNRSLMRWSGFCNPRSSTRLSRSTYCWLTWYRGKGVPERPSCPVSPSVKPLAHSASWRLSTGILDFNSHLGTQVV